MSQSLSAKRKRLRKDRLAAALMQQNDDILAAAADDTRQVACGDAASSPSHARIADNSSVASTPAAAHDEPFSLESSSPGLCSAHRAESGVGHCVPRRNTEHLRSLRRLAAEELLTDTDDDGASIATQCGRDSSPDPFLDPTTADSRPAESCSAQAADDDNLDKDDDGSNEGGLGNAGSTQGIH